MQSAELVGQQVTHYHIEAVIGRGNMTTVYRAVSQQTQQAVALKMLFPPEESALLRQRFQQEIDLVQKLDHPHIVPILDTGKFADHPFIVMPLLKAGSLAERLRLQGSLDEEMTVEIGWQLADALHYAHTMEIVHRDVKPSNILLTEDGQAMLADFGVARALDDPRLTRTGLTVGTPFYMAPEQAASGNHIDGRADLYALGVVLYQLVTGQTPFRGNTNQVMYAHVHEPPPLPSTIATISPSLEKIILHALRKPPEDRFQSGLEFAQALAQFEDDQTDLQTRGDLREVTPSPSLRLHPFLVILLALILGGGVVWTQFSVDIPENTRSASQALPRQTPSPTATTTVSPSTTNTAPLLSGNATTWSLGSLVKGSGDGVFRVAADGQLQHIFDWPTFLALGFDPEAIETITDETLDDWPVSGELTRVLAGADGTYYWVSQGQRWAIGQWQTALENLSPSPADETLLASIPLTLDQSDLPIRTVLASNAQTAYLLVAEGQLRNIPPNLFNAYRVTERDIVQVPDPILFSYNVGLTLQPLVQPEGTVLGQESIYLLLDGQRLPLPVGDTLWRIGYGIDQISQLPDVLLAELPIVCSPESAELFTALTRKILSLTDGNLFAKLGCPVATTKNSSAAWQTFETGSMLWRKDQNLIYVLPPTNVATAYGDTWREGDPQFDNTISAPNGLYQPVRGFGQIWRTANGVRDALGWALGDETAIEAQWQSFEQGIAFGPLPIGDPETETFILIFNDNQYQLVTVR
ncbi:MAG: protein kinase [Chloroflexota bacterium]